MQMLVQNLFKQPLTLKQWETLHKTGKFAKVEKHSVKLHIKVTLQT